MNHRYHITQDYMFRDSWSWTNERGRDVMFLCYKTTRHYFKLPQWTSTPITVVLSDKPEDGLKTEGGSCHRVKVLGGSTSLLVDDRLTESCYTALWEAVQDFPDHTAYMTTEWDDTK